MYLILKIYHVLSRPADRQPADRRGQLPCGGAPPPPFTPDARWPSLLPAPLKQTRAELCCSWPGRRRGGLVVLHQHPSTLTSAMQASDGLRAPPELCSGHAGRAGTAGCRSPWKEEGRWRNSCGTRQGGHAARRGDACASASQRLCAFVAAAAQSAASRVERHRGPGGADLRGIIQVWVFSEETKRTHGPASFGRKTTAVRLQSLSHSTSTAAPRAPTQCFDSPHLPHKPAPRPDYNVLESLKGSIDLQSN